MDNGVLGQVLGGLFGNASRGGESAGSGGLGDVLGRLGAGGAGGGGGLGDLLGGLAGGGRGGGGLGDLLGGALGRGGGSAGQGSASGGGGALIAMLLPLAMQWVQRNGGIGAVLQRMQQKGYSQQASSWVSTGPNQALDAQAIDDVVGADELSRMSQQLDVPREEVAQGFAQVFPAIVDQLSPDGEVPPDADNRLGDGLSQLEGLLRSLQMR